MKPIFVHLTFNQVVAGSIPARPTKYEALKHLWKLKWIVLGEYPRELDLNQAQESLFHFSEQLH